MLGNQNLIFALEFLFEDLDSWNDSFQNQTIEHFFNELDLLHQESQSPTLYIYVCNQQIPCHFWSFKIYFSQNQNANGRDWNIQFKWEHAIRLWWC